MYQIKRLDDNQLENVTGGMSSLMSFGCAFTCFFTALLKCCFDSFETEEKLLKLKSEEESSESDDEIKYKSL